MKPTLTAKEAATEMRRAGFRISEQALINGIEYGAYPFGDIVSVGASGRRTVQIFRSAFEKWLKEVISDGL